MILKHLHQILERWPNGPINPSGTTFGLSFRVSNVQQAQSTNSYSYKSVYASRVTLTNGGSGWRRGDSVSVTVQGQAYTVTVEDETFGYSYASEASATTQLQLMPHPAFSMSTLLFHL